jgi:hypothetical protein
MGQAVRVMPNLKRYDMDLIEKVFGMVSGLLQRMPE